MVENDFSTLGSLWPVLQGKVWVGAGRGEGSALQCKVAALLNLHGSDWYMGSQAQPTTEEMFLIHPQICGLLIKGLPPSSLVTEM